MIYVVVTMLIVCYEMLVNDNFVIFRGNNAVIADEWHLRYDPGYLVNAYHGMSFTEDQLVCLKVVLKHPKHFFKAICAAAAAPVCQPCRYYESLKIKHFELLPSFAQPLSKARPSRRETAAECTGGLPSLVSHSFPYYLNLFLDLLLDL